MSTTTSFFDNSEKFKVKTIVYYKLQEDCRKLLNQLHRWTCMETRMCFRFPLSWSRSGQSGIWTKHSRKGCKPSGDLPGYTLWSTYPSWWFVKKEWMQQLTPKILPNMWSPLEQVWSNHKKVWKNWGQMFVQVAAKQILSHLCGHK